MSYEYPFDLISDLDCDSERVQEELIIFDSCLIMYFETELYNFIILYQCLQLKLQSTYHSVTILWMLVFCVDYCVVPCTLLVMIVCSHPRRAGVIPDGIRSLRFITWGLGKVSC